MHSMSISDPANCVSLAVGFDDSRYALCLAAALARSTPHHRLILVLNALPGPSVETLREELGELPIQVALCCHSGNSGWPGGVQAAYETLIGKRIGTPPMSIALWHDDMLPAKNWTKALLHLESPDAGLVGLTTVALGDYELTPGVEAVDLFNEVVEKQPAEGPIEQDVCSPYLIRQDALLPDEPLLDSSLGPGGWADWDLFERLLARGRSVVRDSSTLCYHWRVGRWFPDGQPDAVASSRRSYLDRWEKAGVWWKRVTSSRKVIYDETGRSD